MQHDSAEPALPDALLLDKSPPLLMSASSSQLLASEEDWASYRGSASRAVG
jgi:hypothetical protein